MPCIDGGSFGRTEYVESGVQTQRLCAVFTAMQKMGVLDKVLKAADCGLKLVHPYAVRNNGGHATNKKTPTARRVNVKRGKQNVSVMKCCPCSPLSKRKSST